MLCLKALAEKLLVASIDRRGDQMAIKFYDDTPLGPERLVKLLRKRRGMRLDPTGVLWLDWKSIQGGADGRRQKRIATTTIVGIKFEASDSMKSCKFVSVLCVQWRFDAVARPWFLPALARKPRPRWSKRLSRA